jgi:hypothetical protein
VIVAALIKLRYLVVAASSSLHFYFMLLVNHFQLRLAVTLLELFDQLLLDGDWNHILLLLNV